MSKFWPALVLVILIPAILLILTQFKVTRIEIDKQTSCLDSEKLLTDLELSQKFTFLISEQKIAEQIKQKYNCVSQIKIEKKLPSTIRVKVTLNEPILKIAETDLALTQDGQVVKLLDNQKLPIVYNIKQIKPEIGQKITDDDLVFAINLATQLQSSDFIPAGIRFIDPNNIAVYNVNSMTAIFTPQKDVTLQVNSLQQVLSKAKIDAVKIDKIDLRFEKPILVYK